MAKAKTLNLENIKKEVNKKFKETKKVIFESGEIVVDCHFRQTKKNVLIAELMGAIKEAALQNIELKDVSVINLVGALMVKHFTNLKCNVDGYDELISFNSVLADGGYLKPIMEAFDIGERTKLMEEVNNSITFMSNLVKQSTENKVEQGG
ncbi:hypothetical protein D1872_155330 [compost metagenome]